MMMDDGKGLVDVDVDVGGGKEKKKFLLIFFIKKTYDSYVTLENNYPLTVFCAPTTKKKK